MPKSKGRKTKPTSRSYVPKKERKKRKSSPRWYPFFMIGLFGLGVAIIVANYFGVMPSTHGNAENQFLWIGLGFIAGGFIASTSYR